MREASSIETPGSRFGGRWNEFGLRNRAQCRARTRSYWYIIAYAQGWWNDQVSSLAQIGRFLLARPRYILLVYFKYQVLPTISVRIRVAVGCCVCACSGFPFVKIPTTDRRHLSWVFFFPPPSLKARKRGAKLNRSKSTRAAVGTRTPAFA